ncbi:hypothetical protein [Microbacterium immunditiarum]|uniref:Uncharacterized protein n=1 Tax=Microbacterium immunditiarum TaxID=337480 RepID=A0A7Y9GKA7_9MICO|nr:hypothetical protein [Microbacterium immunditiarum]NYE17984.1 hypothetical protein [Microbacterium immunditiarum]
MTTPFITATVGKLWQGGMQYEFAGTNLYYLDYKTEAMVDAVLDAAAETGFDVVRT